MHSANQLPCGADVVLQCLLHHGVDIVFAYPGGATLPIHQALTRVQERLRTILPRHEQGGGFAASGYARSSGKVGVCFATSGPGATNLVTCLADAFREGVPLLAITGQVNRPALGSDAFQEIPIVSLCRTITKHHYLVTHVNDIPRVMKEALHVATTGRPGPVLVDVPKDIQARRFAPDYDVPLNLPGYRPKPQEERRPELFSPIAAEDHSPVHILRRLGQIVRARRLDAIWTTGAGPERAWVAQAQCVGAHRWIHSDSQGAIGFALAAGLGAQAAHPGKTVIAVDSAESFLTNVQELACAFVEKLPVKVLLLNRPASVAAAEEKHPDFVALVQGFRVEGRAVLDREEWDDGIESMLASTGPYVLDVHLPRLEHRLAVGTGYEPMGDVIQI